MAQLRNVGPKVVNTDVRGDQQYVFNLISNPPERVAFDRSASSVSAQPIECASTVISVTLGLSESESSS